MTEKTGRTSDLSKEELHHPEGGEGYRTLKEKRSLQEVLHTAMHFEKVAQDFYLALCDRVNKPLRGLVEELAAEETAHYKLFKNLSERENIQQYLAEKISVPANDHRFTDYIQIPDLGEKPDDQEVLLYAIGREQAAMEQYSALANDVPAGDIADLFRFLANEELEHKKELEKVYYEIVHSGGV